MSGDETTSTAVQRVTVEFDVPARMRDGVVLRANVYRPEGRDRCPTVLMRLPYGKDRNPEVDHWLDPVRAAREGFMVVVQDTRGRFASDGEWMPFRHERQDGYDSVEWAARLPGSNGRVGMYGASYFGNTQWMAALEQPPSLAALIPAFTWSEPLDGLLARGGALELGIELPWTLITGLGHVARLQLPENDQEHRIAALLDDFDRLGTDAHWHLPVHENAVLHRHRVPGLGTIGMLADPEIANWSRVAGKHELVTVPTFHIGGWYDIFLQGTLDNYMAMTALGRPARLVVGPWVHDLLLTDPIGELCFGIRSSGLGIPAHDEGDLNDLQLAWFRRYLALIEPLDRASPEAPVRIFVMGRNEWRDESSWPLERARAAKWFLASGGELLPDAPRPDARPTEFVYDPADPVPSIGGQTLVGPALPPGPCDQRALEARQDVCVFTSKPLREDLEVTGPVRVALHAQSSAPSTDWVARLCDVHSDGRSINLCDGIVRLEQGADTCQAIDIDLWSTSNVFLRGHRIRVHVTCSSFPRWDRNLNTGNQRSSHYTAATQSIYHDSERPSFIELPVVD